MTLVNAFGAIALDASVQAVETAVGGVTTVLGTELDVAEENLGLEVLADLAGNDASQTLTFTAGAPRLIWVLCSGGDGRVTSTAQTPTVSLGIPCADGTPMPISLTAASIRVYAATGTTVTCWGFRA